MSNTTCTSCTPILKCGLTYSCRSSCVYSLILLIPGIGDVCIINIPSNIDVCGVQCSTIFSFCFVTFDTLNVTSRFLWFGVGVLGRPIIFEDTYCSYAS